MKQLLIITLLLALLACNASAQTRKAYKDTVVTNFFKREKGLIASDGGYTIPLNNGKVLWLFGDSYIDDYDSITKLVPCLFGASNSILVQPKNDWDWKHTVTLPGSNGDQNFLKDSTKNTKNVIYPLTGFQHGDTVYIFCQKVQRGTGAYDMKNVGDSWGKLYIPTMQMVAYSPLQNFNGFAFGQGFIKEKGFVYTYALKQNKIYAARFPESNPNAKWTFWDGNTWVTDSNKCAVIADVPGFSMYMCKIKNKYILFSTEFSLGCDAGKDIYAATSASPAGPFTKRKVIYTITDRKQGHRPFFYGPLAHPEYINSKNELLMDYSTNGYEPCVPSCVNGLYDPNNYRPKAIRIPLKLIDPGLN